MAKTKISEFSSTPANNTDIDSINLAEGCAPSGINDAIRELMSQLKDWQSGTSNDPYVVGSSGSLTLNQGTANTVPYLNGSKVVTSGTALQFDGSNLGVAVSPSAWGSSFKSIDVNAYTSFYGTTNNAYSGFSQNAYYNGTNWIYRNTNSASNYIQSGGTHTWQYAPSGTAGNAITFTQAMTLDASGRLGLGVTSPSLSFEVGINTAKGYMHSGVGVFSVGTSTSHPYTFDIAGAEKARIDTSGNLLVGKTSSAATTVGWQGGQLGEFYVTKSTSTNADATYYLYSTGAGAYRFYVGLGGTISATSTTITGISDQRLKENIRDLDDGLDIVMALKPRKFDWKEGKGANIKNARGFIAQEFEQVLPDMIEEWKDPAPEGEEPYKAVNANLIPTLVKAIQEQQAIIESLKARLDAANL